MITLYDLAAKNGIHTFSSNSWKTRYILNFKKLPYKTVALEYPDVEPEFIKLGIPSSSTKSDGTPFYTCPSIIDDATKQAITDSYKIMEYLDGKYPDTPRGIPKETEAFQAAFYDQFRQLMSPISPFLLPNALSILNPVSAEYFDRTRTAHFGKPLRDMAPQGEERIEKWKKVEESFNMLNKWLSKSTGPFFMGDTISFADFVVASMLKRIKALTEGKQEWEDITTWNNGRWKAFLESLELYASVEN